ncbi:hypothetical protein MF628_001322 [Paenibacillus polymyxa]|uniref:hypothetical protein n=1 Tax=Paenibacillus polymyxa TaxID=1406 RepID=UPI0020247D54|nr:hypothetical protein [Paenibacillus polymyxa]URJ46756.1 hypothetical protein MF628_001322 [Paenibacillus polymyxa]
MASEKTPNLGLNQIDRTSPKTTYFDLEKYLDQNWRAVDDFAGDVNDGVNEIKKRLDTTERKAVTLEPGVQIVHAEKASPFSLTGLNGRTLVNLLGRWGNLSRLMGVTPYQADIELDTLNKGTMPNSLKVTIKPGYTVGVGFYSNFKFLSGKYYVAIVRAKVGNATDAGISAPNALVESKVIVTDKTKFATAWFRMAPTSDIITNIDLVTQGTVGQYSYFEAARIYEISAAEYTALATMTDDQIDNKYPYVDSVMPVRNPYAIRHGANLLPAFYEWSRTGHTVFISDAYTTSGTLVSGAIGTDAYMVYYLDAVPNLEYTLTNPADSNGFIRISTFDKNAVRLQGMFVKPGESKTIKLGPSAVRMGINISGVTSYTDEFDTNQWTWAAGTVRNFKKPMLNIGNTAKPFKPREDSMLALQTDLYADPVTGANADTVFEKDGQYFKSKKWRGVTLDGSLAWMYGDAIAAGMKQVKVVGLVTGGIAASGTATKYDGKIIPQGSTGSVADTNAVTGAGDFYISIPNTDSGWGDNYTPTADEIKAYFMGWRMYPDKQDAATALYDDSLGVVKYWAYRLDGVTALGGGGMGGATTTVPSTQAPNWTPYQLVYQLATPTVEPIISEGQLTFTEGENPVEVGTGIVLREPSKPVPYQEGAQITNRWAMNKLTSSWPNPFKNLPRKALQVYGNGFSESFNTGTTGDLANWYGGVYIDQLYAYAPEKSYSVTYLMAAPSPVVPFTGNYAANEKTLLADLVDSVQQNTARVSVLENKKADKDSMPVRYYPTLINGWAKYFDYSPSFYKDSSGVVHLEGIVQNGVMDKAIFVLPIGFRPKNSPLVTGVASHNQTSSSRIEVGADGQVIVYNASSVWTNLSDVSFLAEQ